MLSESLAQRRQALVAQAHLQRIQLEASAAEIGKRLSVLDQGFRLAAHMQRMPALTLASALAAAALIVKPRAAVKWIGYAATAYSLARRLRALFAN